ncbi:hypothetical protein Ciccas_002931 [Cichlidogyrus casuarinus]|uniref:Uncharacterized protein n=1 Tax=Cichlidogyrus casuarinus TaxID=1844966 RepID=A0ABD2QFU8_9PLAT
MPVTQKVITRSSSQITNSESGIYSQATEQSPPMLSNFRQKLFSDSHIDELFSRMETSHDLSTTLRSVINDRRMWEFYACRLVRNMVERDQFFLMPQSPGLTDDDHFDTPNERKWATYASKLLSLLLSVAPDKVNEIDRKFLDYNGLNVKHGFNRIGSL